MAKTKLIRFNVKNVKYAPWDGNKYSAIQDLAYANSISLEADYSETKLYGDGEVIGILADDKGKTGTLSVVNINEQYEIDCGRAMKITGGLADVQQRKNIEHALYYEIEAINELGKTITIKNWLFGVFSGKANETYEQTKEDPTINNYEYSLNILGTDLLKKGGLEKYIDATGNTVKVYRLTALPTDAGYATFGNTVPKPTELQG